MANSSSQRHILVKGCGKAAAAAAEADKREDFNKPITSDKGSRSTSDAVPVVSTSASDENNNVEVVPPPPAQMGTATVNGNSVIANGST